MHRRRPESVARQSAFQIIFAQLCIVAVVTIVAWLGWGVFIAKSTSLGGLASVIPSSYFAWRVFARVDARQAKQIIRSFYMGEFIKLLLSVVLVIAFIKIFAVYLPAFFLGFAVAQLGFWLTPLFDNKQRKRA